MNGSHFIAGIRQNLSRFGSLVTEMSTKIFSHPHRLTMCGLKKLASAVLQESWKVLAEWQRWRRPKWTKNNKSPCYAGCLNDLKHKLVSKQNSAYRREHSLTFAQFMSPDGILEPGRVKWFISILQVSIIMCCKITAKKVIVSSSTYQKLFTCQT